MSGRQISVVVVLLLACAAVLYAFVDDPAPVPVNAGDEKLKQQLRTQIEQATAALQQRPSDVDLYSMRGDAYFFNAEFAKALADYEKMAELEPRIVPLHWRRGLAYHYAGRYDDAAKQFAQSFELDKSDRENGIWRFYAQVKTLGLEQARKELHPYTEPDREPLPDIYSLCAGTMQPAEILRKIEAAQVPDGERQKRLFYAHLYIGMDYALLHKTAEAQKHLQLAVENKWAQRSGYGPLYMWHIARLERDLLAKVQSQQTAAP